jgi:3-oxoacyl-[acyl-carrier protein] reductase
VIRYARFAQLTPPGQPAQADTRRGAKRTMNDLLELAGKVALITGGSRGIGAAAARRLARAGADIAVTYQQAADQAAAVVSDAIGTGVQAGMFQANQASPSEVASMVDDVAQRFGHIDILVNNAGVFVAGAIGGLSSEQRAYQWAVNVQGAVVATQQALSHMPDGGRIINVSSAAAERASSGGFADYSATKAALMAYGRSWAHELAPRNITSNNVIVGFVQTDMVIPADSDMGKMALGLLPLQRYADADEVGSVIAFLAGQSASYMTGGDVRVDGGWNA